MDKIIIHQLIIPVVIGVYPQERIDPQELLFDIELAHNSNIAAATDDINQAVDYAALCQAVRDFVSSTSYQLLETLAEKTAEFILQQFNIHWLKLTITKQPFDIQQVGGVSVVVERTAE